MELSGFRVTPGSSVTHRRREVKKPGVGFPYGNQSRGELDERLIVKIGVNTGNFSVE